MHFASYNIRGRTSFGVVLGDGLVDLRLRMAPRYNSLFDLLRGNALAEAEAVVRNVRADFTLTEAELLPPVLTPEKILCIGINYANRDAEMSGGVEGAKYPSMFFRTPGSLVGHDQPIVRPKVSEQLDYEGEIALVVGRSGRHIPRERALEHVAGITLCNEGTIRDWLRHGRFNVTQGKNFDASGSIGPWMTTGVDLARPLHLTVSINGEVTQDDTTASMIFSFADLIAYVTTFMTIKPGDIIATGTPTKKSRSDPPRWLVPGDIITMSVPEIGTLRNTVVEES
ncbi:MAG TPA: fumarylacetoacetate hydrolase family protein [Xanthobacteraceae bacterium]|nr:fumarylacetoacetate hydrolase family protein [Xanthobacteraceae bacterium]